jgi:hypothetical protein
MKTRWSAQPFAALACLQAALLAVVLGSPPVRAADGSGYPLEAFDRLKPGERVTLELQNRVTLSGSFLGTGGSISSEPYAARYARWRSTRTAPPDSASFPPLGEGVVLATTAGDTLRGAFAGSSWPFLLIATNEGGLPRPVRLPRVRALFSLAGTPLAAGDSAGSGAWTSAPAVGVVWLVSGRDTLAVPANMIENVPGWPRPPSTAQGVATAAAGAAVMVYVLPVVIVAFAVWFVSSVIPTPH